MKIFLKKGKRFGNWILKQRLGRGGNGEVWSCQNQNGDIKAIKLLMKINPKAYNRFVDETTVVEKNSDVEGIIYLEEKYLPEELGKEFPYFVMPLAESSEDKLNELSIEEKIDAILQVAETLSELHKRKIFHRDIKPANILFFDSRFALADFGLVDYPNKKDVSSVNEVIGAKWTIAPEMRRNSSNADGAKADVYSLAKTLWIYLTDNKKGFDGQYSTESIIHLKNFYPESYLSPIDNLLMASTDNDPSRRPNIDEFILALQNWKKLTNDFKETNQQQWFEIQSKLFPTSIPKRVIWENIDDIIKILKVICTYSNLNHLLFPNGGGNDLVDARLSYEDGCIELDFGSIDILKPKRLIFESFGFNYEWNYFRLEADELEPSDVTTDNENEYFRQEHNREDLSELSPQKYYPYYILEDSSYYKNDYPITEFSRQVTRWFSGSFVIFCKTSIYNSIPETYDGRHDKMTTDEFRGYIQMFVDYMKRRKNELPIQDPKSKLS